MLTYLRRRLGLKIFLSYLVVILAGGIVLAVATELAVPSAFERHMAGMGGMMGRMMGNAAGTGRELFLNFRAAVTEALALAALVAFLAAVVVSAFVSRQVVAPVRAMLSASQRIAEGRFEERVQLPTDKDPGEFDELSQLALSFNQMAIRLEETEARRRQLIGDVAHELRTPLTTIKGSIEGLMDGVLPAGGETYQQLYQETDRLGRLVDDLQALSRVEAGAYSLNPGPVTVASLVEATLARLRRQYEDKGVRLEVHLPPGLPRVFADEDRIGQVLLNLAGNALQYTPSGGRVQIAAQARGEQVQITISDNGIGIPPQHLPHIFDRFYRVDKSRSRAGGGSGIGLTIARHLVEAHGGRIWVESPGEGLGSAFTFTLPASAPQHDA